MCFWGFREGGKRRDKLPLILSSTKVWPATNCVVMTSEPSIMTGPEREESCVKKYLRYDSRSTVRASLFELLMVQSIRRCLICVSDLAVWRIQTSLITRLLSGESLEYASQTRVPRPTTIVSALKPERSFMVRKVSSRMRMSY